MSKKQQSGGNARKADTYRALQRQWARGSGEGGPGDELGVAALAPLCQDTVPVQGHASLAQGLLDSALQLGVVETGQPRAERRLHEVDARAINSQRQERFCCGVNVNCIPIDNNVP